MNILFLLYYSHLVPHSSSIVFLLGGRLVVHYIKKGNSGVHAPHDLGHQVLAGVESRNLPLSCCPTVLFILCVCIFLVVDCSSPFLPVQPYGQITEERITRLWW